MVKFHFVSIPYGKGKVKEMELEDTKKKVSIPYGKGKEQHFVLCLQCTP